MSKDDQINIQFLLEKFRNKFTNQMLGSLRYQKKKQFLIRTPYPSIPLVFYRDRDLFCQILDKNRQIQDYLSWFIVWMKDYEIMKKIALYSTFALAELFSELKKHRKEVWYKDLSEDFEFWKEFVRQDSYNFDSITLASPKILENVGKVKALISIRPECFLHISNKMKKNTELIIAACEQSGNFFRYLPSYLLKKKMVLNALEKNTDIDLKLIPEKMWDAEIAHTAAKFKPYHLQDIPKTFVTREIVEMAIGQEGFGYVFHQVKNPALRKDEELSIICLRNGGNLDNLERSAITKNIAMVAVEKDEYNYVRLSDDFKNDLDICLSVLKKSGCALYEMSEEMKANRQIALQAVKTRASALYYLPTHFLTDREIVLLAFSHGEPLSYDFDYYPPYYFSQTQLAERSNHVHQRKNYPPLIELIPKEFFINDRELILQMTKQFPHILPTVPKDIINDREFWQDCLAINGDCIEFAPPEFKNDFELCCIALKNYRNSIVHFPVEVQSDPRIFKLLMETVPHDKRFRNKVARELKDLVIEFQFENRSNGTASQNIGKSIATIPNSDLYNNSKLKKMRAQDLEDNYLGCYVPIKD
ncbi:predicted protein [Naegleria gruberi]|uniref:Predicted protein n=1 Tax=Naegleria gruberi TaxID=5762 RepID=D2VDF5_NAEGR|nr:uncharacterized protein NAEGRDRAFT_48600 [Naegleria gruberi]EFC45134.1 predicted protein [Naegleria gruberi]|eukprot:XP_002677878.1 predicted protein [Naegleria gruberi strain NEG-M]